MHISEGVLSWPILAGGYALAVAGTAVGLKKLDSDRIVTAAMLTAAFFVGSLVHVPIGPVSAHLILNGLLAAILGWAAFPAIMAALALQAVFFQYGGLTVLGVNTVDMAAPAVIVALLFKPLLASEGKARLVGGFLIGALSVAGAGIVTALALALSDQGFVAPAKAIFLMHLPIMAVEGLVTAFAVGFIAKARPRLLFPANTEVS